MALKAISLKTHPSLYEIWVKEQMAKEPAVLEWFLTNYECISSDIRLAERNINMVEKEISSNREVRLS